MEMYLDSTSRKFFNEKEDTQKRRTGDSIHNIPTTSAKFVSKPASKQTATSIVDLILLEESSRDKYSTKGAVTTPKGLEKLLIMEILSEKIFDTLCISKQKKALQAIR